MSVHNLRKFHNYIKKTLINDTFDYINDNFNVETVKLLDLAVGRGGDINKWYDKGIMTVYGFDIDEDSIKGKNGAIHRLKWLNNQLRKNGNPIPHYRFFVTDLSKSEAIDYVNSKVDGNKFNIVSCQFAIHYFFETEETLDTFIQIVNNNIATDGFFIGTCMDANKLKSLFDEKEAIEEDLYQLKKVYHDIKTPYNNTYIASLGTKKDKNIYFQDKPSIEYLVDIEELKKVCQKYNIEYVGVTGFDEWYEKYLKDDGRFPLTEEEKKFSFLNLSFVFKKV